jgi:hypothetical protein
MMFMNYAIPNISFGWCKKGRNSFEAKEHTIKPSKAADQIAIVQGYGDPDCQFR